MKFSCDKLSICDAINSVSKAVPSKSTHQVLEGMKINVTDSQIELTGYDLEIGIRTVIPAITDGAEEFVVNARLFSEMVRRMSGDVVYFELDSNNTLNISSIETECTLSVMSSDEYPELPQFEYESGISLKQGLLKSMFSQTNHAVSTNETKPIFTGILFDIENGSFTMVGMDGYRLAIRTEVIDCQDKYYFVVPKKVLSEVSALIKDDASDKICNIYTNNKHIIFDLNGFLVISRLLEGQFHNYKISIPNEYKTEAIVNTKDFITSMERCSLLLNDKNKSPIRCTFENNKVKIECKTALGKINDAFSSDISGDVVTIGFNNKFAIDAFKAAEGDKVRICLNGSMKVIKILPLEGEDFIFLLMPIQLK